MFKTAAFAAGLALSAQAQFDLSGLDGALAEFETAMNDIAVDAGATTGATTDLDLGGFGDMFSNALGGTKDSCESTYEGVWDDAGSQCIIYEGADILCPDSGCMSPLASCYSQEVCDEFSSSSALVVTIIVLLLVAVAAAIVVYCCFCKDKTQTDDNYEKSG